MKNVFLFSILLVIGMVGSQAMPVLLGNAYLTAAHLVTLLTMIFLAFIMIHVGREFDIDKSRLGDYAWDYVVAMTAAALPWLLVCAYFILVMLPESSWTNWQAWKESLLSSRFAAPTSAGVLFAMLTAAGLGSTWLYGKARVLAIFDDLDTVLLMIPLKMLMVGLVWQLGLIAIIMAVLLWVAWRYLHRWQIPSSWPWVLGYATVIGLVSEAVYFASTLVDETVAVHIEVLLPAFVLGCTMARPERSSAAGQDARADETAHENAAEHRVATIVSAIFMVLVGLSMPCLFGEPTPAATTTLSAAQPMPGWGMMALHVVLLTVLCNLGKMYPAFCYRREAPGSARLALAIGMWPRGEVGAGVLVASLSYGLGGPLIASAMLCLALNLLLTGVFIVMIRKLVAA
jgi:hypothetical protein